MIDILLATYNGEKYIESQIYSLLAQTFKDWRLIIHDDGSSDRTIEIVKKFAKIDNRINLIEDNIKCGGAGSNFLHLLQNYSDADFIIFCDQDDIWLENKLEIMLSHFCNDDVPQGVFAGGYLYSDKKGIMGNIPSPILTKFEETFFIAGGLQGCSFMFDKKIRNFAKSYNGYMVMHDFLITLITLTFGKLTYIDNKLMLYRQEHEGKTTSNVDSNSMSKWKNKHPVIDYKHHKSLVNFVESFYENLSLHQKNKYSQFDLFYKTDNLFMRLLIILKNKFSLDRSVFKLISKTIIRPIK